MINKGGIRLDLLKILNELEEYVEESTKMPFTGKVLIDDDVLMEFVDRIRSSLPEEIRQAKWITKERQKIITEAQKEAEKIVEDAKQHITKIADESEINKQAQKYAEEIVQKAQGVANEITNGANQYADDILGSLEGNLNKIMTSVKNGREELKDHKNKNKTA